MSCDAWTWGPEATKDEEYVLIRQLGVLPNGRFLIEQEHARLTRDEFNAAASLRVDCATRTHYQSTNVARDYVFRVLYDKELMKKITTWDQPPPAPTAGPSAGPTASTPSSTTTAAAQEPAAKAAALG